MKREPKQPWRCRVCAWPADRHVICACGRRFLRNDQGQIVHPEPWCDAMMRGEENPQIGGPADGS